MEKITYPSPGFVPSVASYLHRVDSLDADVAIVGVPYDLGVGYLSGTRFDQGVSEKHRHSTVRPNRVHDLNDRYF